MVIVILKNLKLDQHNELTTIIKLHLFDSEVSISISLHRYDNVKSYDDYNIYR